MIALSLATDLIVIAGWQKKAAASLCSSVVISPPSLLCDVRNFQGSAAELLALRLAGVSTPRSS